MSTACRSAVCLSAARGGALLRRSPPSLLLLLSSNERLQCVYALPPLIENFAPCYTLSAAASEVVRPSADYDELVPYLLLLHVPMLLSSSPVALRVEAAAAVITLWC